MKHLKLFKESFKSELIKNTDIVMDQMIEDVEDCLLHLSDKFTMQLHKTYKSTQNQYMQYIFYPKIDMVDTFYNELKRSLNQLRLIGFECGFHAVLPENRKWEIKCRSNKNIIDKQFIVRQQNVYSYDIKLIKSEDRFISDVKDFISNIDLSQGSTKLLSNDEFFISIYIW